MSDLGKLLYLRGIAAEYYSYSGDRIVVPHEDRLKLLAAVGIDTDDEQAISRAVFELDAKPWQSWLNEFNIISLGDREHLDIRVHPDEKFSPFKWQITTETEQQLSGDFTPAELQESGEYYIDGVRYTAHRLPLVDLPIGYHRIQLRSQQRALQAALAVAPSRCYEGEKDAPQQRPWGISCQLYTLRSSRNWGIGDFTDLKELIDRSSAFGVDLIGLNPLHAPHIAGADFASPYSPSDRRFLNPLYIDPEQVEEFGGSKKVAEYFNSRDYQQRLEALRAAPLVDYTAVAALKYPVFEEMFQHFMHRHLRSDSPRARQFRHFVEQRGEALQSFSGYESQHSALLFPDAKDPCFHQYLQWLADLQLRQCQTLARAQGMAIGLMGDLAVGAVQDGAEVSGSGGIFCANASIGAPPDPFSQEGQNWNLPAIDPVALRRDNYRHFIDLLRANMSPYGALRIDHVMGLLRLWWCLPDIAGGTYVYYPFEDLLAILRLESQRNACMVVGEDMGVVPDELRVRMAETGIYSNKVFYFERQHDQQFMQPQDHRPDALLMVTNHDVSTLAGWWNATDLEIRCNIGLLDPEHELPSLRHERQADKARLLAWLQSQQLLPEGWVQNEAESALQRPFDFALCRAILLASAHSRSKIMSFQLEDLQLLEDPVNIPGTYREYPNWRRKQAVETGSLFDTPEIQQLLSSIDRERTL